MITILNTGSTQVKRREIKVLFVCNGNLCRSPMAEGIFNHLIKKYAGKPFSKFDWRVSSAGLENFNSAELPEQRCLQVLHENKITSIHSARQIRSHDFKFYDYILCMDNDQLLKLVEIAPPEKKARLYTIGDFIKGREKDIVDPCPESGINSFRICFEKLYIGCENFFFHINDRRLI